MCTERSLLFLAVVMERGEGKGQESDFQFAPSTSNYNHTWLHRPKSWRGSMIICRKPKFRWPNMPEVETIGRSQMIQRFVS